MKNSVLRIKVSKKSILLYIITVAVSAALLILAHNAVYDESVLFNGGYDDGALTVKVTEILSDTSDGSMKVDGTEFEGITFKCVVLKGERKGEEITACEFVSEYDAVAVKKVEVGNRVLIAEMQGGEVDYYMHDFDRSVPIWILGGAFVMLVLIFGRKSGVNTVISLALTCLAIFAVFIPSVLSGHNAYLWSILTCIYIIVMTLLIIDGYHTKTVAAIIGCTGGVVIAGVLTVVTARYLNLTGYTSEDTIYIMQSFPLDLHALTFAGIILGSVGAVMDVAVSISSSIREIYEQVEKPSFSGLVRSGLNIGRDIMGTMANTLVLAYIGCELTATLLYVVCSTSLTTLFSREKIVEELLQALVGSIGMLLTIPLTAVLSAALYMGCARLKFQRKDKYFVEPSTEPSLFEREDK